MENVQVIYTESNSCNLQYGDDEYDIQFAEFIIYYTINLIWSAKESRMFLKWVVLYLYALN